MESKTSGSYDYNAELRMEENEDVCNAYSTEKAPDKASESKKQILLPGMIILAAILAAILIYTEGILPANKYRTAAVLQS